MSEKRYYQCIWCGARCHDLAAAEDHIKQCPQNPSHQIIQGLEEKVRRQAETISQFLAAEMKKDAKIAEYESDELARAFASDDERDLAQKVVQLGHRLNEALRDRDEWKQASEKDGELAGNLRRELAVTNRNWKDAEFELSYARAERKAFAVAIAEEFRRMDQRPLGLDGWLHWSF